MEAVAGNDGLVWRPSNFSHWHITEIWREASWPAGVGSRFCVSPTKRRAMTGDRVRCRESVRGENFKADKL